MTKHFGHSIKTYKIMYNYVFKIFQITFFFFETFELSKSEFFLSVLCQFN